MRKIFLAAAISLLTTSAQAQLPTAHTSWPVPGGGGFGHTYYGNGRHSITNGAGTFHYTEQNQWGLQQRGVNNVIRPAPVRRGATRGYPGYSVPNFRIAPYRMFQEVEGDSWMRFDY